MFERFQLHLQKAPAHQDERVSASVSEAQEADPQTTRSTPDSGEKNPTLRMPQASESMLPWVLLSAGATPEPGVINSGIPDAQYVPAPP